MAVWIKRFSHKSNFFDGTDFNIEQEKLSESLKRFRKFLAVDPHHKLKQRLAPLFKKNFSMRVYLYENHKHSANIIEIDKQIFFVRTFFYNSLTGALKQEFSSYLLFRKLFELLLDDLLLRKTLVKTSEKIFTTYLQEIFPAFVQKTSYFLSTRKKQLSPKEYQTLYGTLLNGRPNHFPLETAAFFFIAFLHHPLQDFKNFFLESQIQKLPLFALEKQILKEALGSPFFLPQSSAFFYHPPQLSTNSFSYVETDSLLSALPNHTQERYFQISRYFQRKRQNIETYVAKVLLQRSLFFWCLWSPSPYLCQDIQTLLPLLLKRKKLSILAIALPKGASTPITRYLLEKTNSLDEVAESTTKIYPPHFPAYAKEISPYLTFLETLKRHLYLTKQLRSHSSKLPFKLFCFAPIYSSSLKNVLLLKNGTVKVKVSLAWRQLLLSLQKQTPASTTAKAPLTLFFYCLNPFFPSELILAPAIERLIHVDPFTGFGPEQPVNSLSLYSQHQRQRLSSFVVSPLSFSNAPTTFLNEPIIFYPTSSSLPSSHKRSEAPLLVEDRNFNRFQLFDSLLYSTLSNSDNQQRFITTSSDDSAKNS